MNLVIQLLALACCLVAYSAPTNVVLLMADDQGWGQTGYYNHPILKTPNLNSMAENGLRFDRFYSGGPVCSPTRATILTGRTHDRTGVFDHGYALRDQEKTLSEAMKKAHYATGHFGKWHLNGLRGPGVPILSNDTHGPGPFGFNTWLSVTNFFDLNPVMSRNGKFEEFEGDSSDIIVSEALQFITRQVKSQFPFFAVIWYGTPHSPWMAQESDQKAFTKLNDKSKKHYAELVAMDRSVGTLRKGLRQLGIEKNTLVWFTSDNGGLPGIKPSTTGGLRDYKGSMYEGGLRVPAIIEWPNGIPKTRITKYPAGTVDIFPTVAEVVGLPESSMLLPQDGLSLVPLMKEEIGPRKKALPFHSRGRSVLIDNDYKILSFPKENNKNPQRIELYNLAEDTSESNNLINKNPEISRKMATLLKESTSSIEASMNGIDYPEGKVNKDQPVRQFWTELGAYQPYFEKWKERPEYRSRLKKVK